MKKLKRITDEEINLAWVDEELHPHPELDILFHARILVREQLEHDQKQVDELVGEIFEEIERHKVTDIHRGLPQIARVVYDFGQYELEILKQKYLGGEK